MKALFICLTDYQMLNALNIKTNLLKDKEADIIVFNNKAGLEDLVKRLQNTKIFSNVYLYTEKFTDLHKYVRNLSENKKGISFGTAFSNTVKNMWIKVLSKVESAEKNINRGIINNKIIDFSQYDEIFGIETKAFVSKCIGLVLEKQKGKCIVNSIDEGLASYLSKGIKGKHRIDNIYLYAPEMAIYKDSFANIITIPKIKKVDTEFIKTLNFIFGFSEDDKIDLQNKIIFFDQNWDAMPKYLRNLTGIKKILFGNLHKRHLKESVIYDAKIKMFGILTKIMQPAKVWVKLHPRSNNEFIDDYKNNGAEFLPNITAPWEVFGCNCNIKNNLWVTIHSSALCAYDFTIDAENQNKFIFLYKFILKNVHNIDEINRFFENFQSHHSKNVFLPKDEDEFIELSKELKNEESVPK